MLLTHILFIYCTKLYDVWPDVIRPILFVIMVHALKDHVGTRVSPTLML